MFDFVLGMFQLTIHIHIIASDAYSINDFSIRVSWVVPLFCGNPPHDWQRWWIFQSSIITSFWK